MSFAIKKRFPKFYKFSKNITNRIPMRTTLWDKKSYNFNFRIYKMLKSWKSHELKEEADMVYKLYDGGDFIDIGAFNGFYSFLLSTKAKDNDNFINCEPNSLVLSELYDNLSVLKKSLEISITQ